jgi:hypothetical protein
MRGSRVRLGAGVVATGVIGLLALAGCEAILGVGSLKERSASDDGGLATNGEDSGFDGGTTESGTADSGTADSGKADSATDAGSAPDGPCTIPSGAKCAVDPQCGCPANEKCDLPNGTAACISFGTTPVGDLCNDGETDCEPGDTCTNGVCHPFCTTPFQPCPAITDGPPLGECTENNGNTAQGFLCPLSCTLAPNSCKSETGCVTVPSADGGVFTDCEAPGTGGTGDSCSTDTDCQKGFGCSTQTCYQWCELSPATTTCVTRTCTGPAVATVNGISYAFCH